LDVALFTKDWTINDELLMLEGIDKCGVGNWKVISEYMDGSKTPKQLEEHYWEVYMGRHGHCLPKTVIDRQQNVVKPLADVYPVGKQLTDVPVRNGVDWEYAREEAVVRDDGKSAYAKQKDKLEVTQRLDKLPGSDLPGFIPLREDFDIEHENDAEMLLADMEFHDDDHPSEKELKLQVIKIFNKKLDSRNKRKRYAIDRGLVDFKKQQHQDRKRTKEEREMVARLRMFARFHSAEEHDSLVDGLVRARRLRQQIELLQHCRSMGIRTLDQARQFEIDRKKREQELKARKQRENDAYLHQSSGASSSSAARRRAGDDDELLSLDYTRRGVSRGSRANGGSDNLDTWGGAVADISKAPGVELLSDRELELCTKVPLLPMHYLAAKDAVVREAYRNGLLTREGMRRVVSIPPPKEGIVFDFFIKEAVLSGDSSNSAAAK
jgi:transcriptional adapter 2-alpha